MKIKMSVGKIRIVLAIIGTVAVGAVSLVVLSEPGRREGLNLVIGKEDFSNLRDGTYIGTYTGTKDSFRNAKVQVTVSQGKVSKIKVTEGLLADRKQLIKIRAGQSINDLLGRVIAAQSLQVDTISGATISSKIHLKAVENAVAKAHAK